jgi:hypothetical protein
VIVKALKLLTAAIVVVWLTVGIAVAGGGAGPVGVVAPFVVLGLGVWWLVRIARKPRTGKGEQ